MVWYDTGFLGDFLKSFAVKAGQTIADRLFRSHHGERERIRAKKDYIESAPDSAADLNKIIDALRADLAKKERQLWEYQQITRHFVELCESREPYIGHRPATGLTEGKRE